METPIQDIWERIETWLRNNAPELLNNLNSGATINEIARVEGVVGVSFPEDFRLSLSIHNGQKNSSPRFFYGNCKLLSLSHIEEIWRKGVADFTGDKPRFPTYYHRNSELRDRNKAKRILGDYTVSGFYLNDNEKDMLVNGTIQALNWHPQWIPIAVDDNDDPYFIDLAPPNEGTKGQIIHRFDIEQVYWINSSFTDYLSKFVNDLEASNYTVGSDKQFRLHPIEGFDSLGLFLKYPCNS
jgi:cell wall assembly regulator SMI1